MAQTIVLPTEKDPARLAPNGAAQQRPAESSSLAGMLAMIVFSLVLVVWIFAGAV